MSLRIFRNLILISLAAAATAQAGTLYVNAKSGNDANAGTSADKPLASIQKACDIVKPGDTVVVGPGVYYGPVKLSVAGTKDNPIRFEADKVEKDRVIITNADRAIREGKATWTLEDEKLGLYSTPFNHQPARMLSDEADCAPYAALNSLKNFEITFEMPGILKGFFYDEHAKKLYVRLHPQSEKYNYGSNDPAKHVIKVAPPTGNGEKGVLPGRPDWANWTIDVKAPAHVVLDGFTFETPGFAGVHAIASNVTVRNSWFRGCRGGVAGTRPGYLAWEPAENYAADDIVIEYCDYTQGGPYADTIEIVETYRDDPRYNKTQFYWWQRKSLGTNPPLVRTLEYETAGLALGVGARWTIRNNYVHDVFDGLSAQSMNWAIDADIYENRFERCIDNAFEAENHAQNVRFHHNEMVDCYMPISWQPLGGFPFPGPIYVYRNLIYMTPEAQALHKKMSWDWAFFKCGASDKQWEWAGKSVNPVTGKTLTETGKDAVIDVPGGFWTYNNTVYMPGANFHEGAGGARRYTGFQFQNNIFVTEPNEIKRRPFPKDTYMQFSNNVFASPSPRTTEVGPILAGTSGTVLDEEAKIGFTDAAKFDFSLKSGSPAIGAGVPVAGQKDWSKDAGAIPFGETWKSPVVGPQPR